MFHPTMKAKLDLSEILGQISISDCTEKPAAETQKDTLLVRTPPQFVGYDSGSDRQGRTRAKFYVSCIRN